MYEKHFQFKSGRCANYLWAVIFALTFFMAVSICFGAQSYSFNEKAETILQCIAEKDYTGALHLLHKVIAQEPHSYDAHMARSQVFLLLGQVPQALTDLDTILQQQPNDDATQLYRCIVQESQAKNQAEATQCYVALAQKIEQRSSPAELAQNATYPRVLILAGLPNAERARTNYLQRLNPNDVLEASEAQDLRIFSRETTVPYIKMIQEAQKAALN